MAQRDVNLTAGRRWLSNVGQHISLFVNGVKEKIALKLIAAQGKVQVQAQHGEIEATAEQQFTITSTQGKVVLAAKEEILLTSGGGYIRIKDGNIDIHCPDLASFKAAKHPWSGPASMKVAMPDFTRSELPAMGPYAIHYRLLDQVTEKPLANHRYRLTTQSGEVVEGIADKAGWTRLIETAAPETVTAMVAELPVDMDNLSHGDILK